jgi:hypothetical protein
MVVQLLAGARFLYPFQSVQAGSGRKEKKVYLCLYNPHIQQTPLLRPKRGNSIYSLLRKTSKRS